jgi:hypothetical protein
VRVRPGKVTRVTVRLSGAARRALGRSGRRGVKITVRVTVRDAARRTGMASRTVLVRR